MCTKTDGTVKVGDKVLYGVGVVQSGTYYQVEAIAGSLVALQGYYLSAVSGNIFWVTIATFNVTYKKFSLCECCKQPVAAK